MTENKTQKKEINKPLVWQGMKRPVVRVNDGVGDDYEVVATLGLRHIEDGKVYRLVSFGRQDDGKLTIYRLNPISLNGILAHEAIFHISENETVGEVDYE